MNITGIGTKNKCICCIHMQACLGIGINGQIFWYLQDTWTYDQAGNDSVFCFSIQF